MHVHTCFLLVLLLLSACATRGVKVTFANNVVARPSYSLRAPANRGWVFLPTEEGRSPSGVFMQKKQQSVVSEVRTAIVPILDRARQLSTAAQVADDYRNIEEQIMIEQGVKPRLYQLRDVRRAAANVAGKQFFKLEYVAYTAEMQNLGALYLLFRSPEKNDAFLLVHFVEHVPTGDEADEAARDDLRAILESVSLRE